MKTCVTTSYTERLEHHPDAPLCPFLLTADSCGPRVLALLCLTASVCQPFLTESLTIGLAGLGRMALTQTQAGRKHTLSWPWLPQHSTQHHPWLHFYQVLSNLGPF